MGRTLFHAANSYFIPNVKATAFSCKTNLPPFTAFRGFGGPQGMFVIESAIAKAAESLNIPAIKIQEKNLIREGDTFHYGQTAKKANAIKSWKELKKHYQIDNLSKETDDFNAKNPTVKKGLALMPVCFGISFTKIPMNQARALIHIYQDGSVGVSTGAIEMGQGVNTKLLQIASRFFSIKPERIKIETTNTSRVANTSPTAASTGADLNGKALINACNKIQKRLLKTASGILKTDQNKIQITNESVFVSGKATGLKWEKLIETAFLERQNLSAVGHYATPVIHFDRTAENGHPFAYHVYGTAAITARLDCLRGTYNIENVYIVHDFGTSLNKTIDLGQIEGGVVQGIGWMTMEELRYSRKGELLSNSLSTYKIPDIYAAPKSITCKALETKGPELAILRSKAVGEPPLMYGIGAYFAIRNAIRAFNPEAHIAFDAPLTPEKVLMSLYPAVNAPVTKVSGIM